MKGDEGGEEGEMGEGKGTHTLENGVDCEEVGPDGNYYHAERKGQELHDDGPVIMG